MGLRLLMHLEITFFPYYCEGEMDKFHSEGASWIY